MWDLFKNLLSKKFYQAKIQPLRDKEIGKIFDKDMETKILKYMGIAPDLEDIAVYQKFDNRKYIRQYADYFCITLWDYWLGYETEKWIQDYYFDAHILKQDSEKMNRRMRYEAKLFNLMLWLYKHFTIFESKWQKRKRQDSIMLLPVSYKDLVLNFYKQMRTGGVSWFRI